MDTEQKGAADYVIRVQSELLGPDAVAWNKLLSTQTEPSPFLRAEWLQAMQDSGSACPSRGWHAQHLLLWHGEQLVAGSPCYQKDHSWGEYVFDWAWASAYERAGLRYYPKALVASPFSPVPGTRLLAADAQSRHVLLQALIAQAHERGDSSVHLLFLDATDEDACRQAGLVIREGLQFHWHNPGYIDFEQFLSAMTQTKRKKVRQEQRRVRDAGVRYQVLEGLDIGPADWTFFYQCYERTYWAHGQQPHLEADFFSRVASDMPDHWVMFKALRGEQAVACSLLAVNQPVGPGATADARPTVAYGRYWGCLETIDCLHFDACYYQPLAWCIAKGVTRFEGGAQGEHKLARALLPVRTASAHWLAHPQGAAAIARFVAQEAQGMQEYRDALHGHSPLRRPAAA